MDSKELQQVEHIFKLYLPLKKIKIWQCNLYLACSLNT